jgi:DNA polymerase-3 subunit alpha
VAYQTAYLKAHFPAEYMAAVLNNQVSVEKLKFYMEECQRMGLNVAGPNVCESLKGFAVTKQGVIRFGLNAIKGVGEAAVENIVAEREKSGTYTDIFEFMQRVNLKTVNKRTLENMALSGALDCFPQLHRAQYFHTAAGDPANGLERLVRFGSQIQQSTLTAENSLFGSVSMPAVKPPVIPECEPWSLTEMLDKEKEVVGIYLSAHPLDPFRFELTHFGITPINEANPASTKPIRLAGFISDASHLINKKGNKFGKFVLNDYSGNLEILLWDQKYVKFGNFLSNSQKVMIQGQYEANRFREGQFDLRIDNIVLLEQVKTLHSKRLTISIPLAALDGPILNFLTENIQRHPGSTDYTLHLYDDTYVTRLKSHTKKLAVNDELIAFLEETDQLEYQLEVS